MFSFPFSFFYPFPIFLLQPPPHRYLCSLFPLAFFALCRSLRPDLYGKDREVPGDVPAGVRALHQLPQAQHSPLLAEASDEGDGPADDRGVPRQSLPSHEGGMSQRTLPPALLRGLRGPGGVRHTCRHAKGRESWSETEDGLVHRACGGRMEGESSLQESAFL